MQLVPLCVRRERQLTHFDAPRATPTGHAKLKRSEGALNRLYELVEQD
jgi:hypothetical protein